MRTSDSIEGNQLRTRLVWLIVGYLLVFFVIYLSLTPSPIEIPVSAGDKLSHVLAYFVLMSWFANLYQDHAHRTGFALGFITLGATLEFLQQWTGFRAFEVNDMLAGAAGVALGLVAAPPRLPNYLGYLDRICMALFKPDLDRS